MKKNQQIVNNLKTLSRVRKLNEEDKISDFELFICELNYITGLRIAELAQVLNSSGEDWDVTIRPGEDWKIDHQGIPWNFKRTFRHEENLKINNIILKGGKTSFVLLPIIFFAQGTNIGQFFSPSTPGKNKYTARMLNYTFERISKVAEEKITSHGWRRGVATDADRLGLPRQQIQKLLNHENYATTEKYIQSNNKEDASKNVLNAIVNWDKGNFDTEDKSAQIKFLQAENLILKNRIDYLLMKEKE